MSKLDKIIARLIQEPIVRDFGWEDLVTLMASKGFDLDQGGGGSHCKFFLHDDKSIVVNTYRPHPSGILHTYQVKEIRRFLKERGLIQ